MKHLFILCCLIFTVSAFAQKQDDLGLEDVEVNPTYKEEIATELEEASKSPEYDEKTQVVLKKVADIYKEDAKDSKKEEPKKKKKNVLSVLSSVGRGVGKGAAWVTRKTAKPFVNASGFLTGFFEKEEKNKDIIPVYQAFLKHQKEFDNLYLTASSPEDMVNKIEERMGEIMAEQEDCDCEDRDLLKDNLRWHEAIVSLVGQIYGPKLALGIISSKLAGLYGSTVVLADLGTGVSAAVCSGKKSKEKMKTDEDVRDFCNYVAGKTAYELLKSRLSGYLSGKKARYKFNH